MRKSTVRKVKNVVKKGIKLAGKILPIGIILKKLTRLVKPLLNRVLRFALDKLPPALRPAASQLATRLLGKLKSPAEDPSGSTAQPAAQPDAQPDAQPTTPDMSLLQQELNLGLATLLLASDETEGEVALAEMLTEMGRGDGDALAGLQRARERFVRVMRSSA